MRHFNPHSEIPARILASDLDGTLIPLPENTQNEADLKIIRARHDAGQLPLIFATGRQFESVMEAIETYGLPEPEWIVCDVGSRIFRKVDGRYEKFGPYETHLAELVEGFDRSRIEALLADVAGLRFQKPEYQTEHKISYECDADGVDALVREVSGKIADAGVPYSSMGSLDPFLNVGLIDVLPGAVNKAYALVWLATHADFRPDEVVYAGDSGNDEAALCSGFRAIVVSNASAGLAERVEASLAADGFPDRLFLAANTATSGVLAGIRHFGLLKDASRA